MKPRIALSTLLFVTATAAPLVAQAQKAAPQPDHAFGVGIMVGVPTGLNGKYYLKNHMAIDFAIGDEYRGTYRDDGLELHADVLWHPTVLTKQPNFTIPFYVGVGARFFENNYYYKNGNTVFYDDNVERFGVRVPFGVLMDFADPSIDIFFELAMCVDLLVLEHNDSGYYDHSRFDINGSLGARYYF